MTTVTPPPAETTKPKLTITAAPKAKLSANTATFRFKADEPGSTFRCKLDHKAFVRCSSPKTYRGLASGKHVFKVKAIDSAGNSSPVTTRRFTVTA